MRLTCFVHLGTHRGPSRHPSARRCRPRKSPELAPNSTTRSTRRCAPRRRGHVGPGEDALPRCDPPCRRRPHCAGADGPGHLRRADGRRRGASRLPGRASCLIALVPAHPRRRGARRNSRLRGEHRGQHQGRGGNSGGNRHSVATMTTEESIGYVGGVIPPASTYLTC